MPSEARAALNAIVVVGDGQVGLAAAIALRRALPRAAVTVVRCQPDPSAIADRSMTSLPRTDAFHERIGLEEDGFIMHAGASHRLGVRFLNWQQQNASYIHGYGAGSVGDETVSQCLADANKFANPTEDTVSPLSDIDYALRYHQPAYRGRLVALANHLGVHQLAVPMTAAMSDGNGGIAQIALANGENVTADLFVDCSGPQALLMDATQQASFQSWSAMLPCNRLMLAAAPAAPALSVTDTIEAHNFGWRSTIFGRDGAHHAFAYHADVGSEAEIASGLGQESGEVIALEPGRPANSWVGNVVAFGDAAAAFEPLHWINLALAHEQILLFLELLPGRDIEARERAEYNRRAGAMADRVRDYIGLHYSAPNPPEGPFWQHAVRLQRSSGLALTLSEYTKRGRLPFFEEETLPRESWQSAMDCIGIAAGPNAQSLSTPKEIVADRLKKQQMRSAKALELAAPYPAWLKKHIESKT